MLKDHARLIIYGSLMICTSEITKGITILAMIITILHDFLQAPVTCDGSRETGAGSFFNFFIFLGGLLTTTNFEEILFFDILFVYRLKGWNWDRDGLGVQFFYVNL